MNGTGLNPDVDTYVESPFDYSFQLIDASDGTYSTGFPGTYVGGYAGPADFQPDHSFTWSGGPWNWSKQLCTSKSGQYNGTGTVYDATCSLSINRTSVQVSLDLLWALCMWVLCTCARAEQRLATGLANMGSAPVCRAKPCQSQPCA